MAEGKGPWWSQASTSPHGGGPSRQLFSWAPFSYPHDGDDDLSSLDSSISFNTSYPYPYPYGKSPGPPSLPPVVAPREIIGSWRDPAMDFFSGVQFGPRR